MSPTGALKDERMTSFTKCVTALLGKMLYVDETAMIPLLRITGNDKDSYISNKSNLPSNFTKLSKYIIIRSWQLGVQQKGEWQQQHFCTVPTQVSYSHRGNCQPGVIQIHATWQ
jgi:hypothetical protein